MTSSFDNLYNTLNSAQKQAVDNTEGVVIVNAGPGSGKTQILGLRIANILRQSDTKASNILCLTYTDNACNNMIERLRSMIGPDANKINVFTFHSFGAQIIADNPLKFFGGSSFIPIDQLGRIKILSGIFDNLALQSPLSSYHPSEGFIFLKDVDNAIALLKKAGITPMEYLQIVEYLQIITPGIKDIFLVFNQNASAKLVEQIPNVIEQLNQLNLQTKTVHGPSLTENHYDLIENLIEELNIVYTQAHANEKVSATGLSAFKKKYLQDGMFKEFAKLTYYIELADVYQKYQTQLYTIGLFDFEDMIMETVLQLSKPENKYFLSILQENYQYILVDEFQDTNDLQLRLLGLILQGSIGDPNLMVVGDPDQSIFKFQGANSSNFLQLKNLYPNAMVIDLIDNYRSRAEILQLAHSIITQDGTHTGHGKLMIAHRV